MTSCIEQSSDYKYQLICLTKDSVITCGTRCYVPTLRVLNIFRYKILPERDLARLEIAYNFTTTLEV